MIGPNLRFLRKEKGWTQQRFASKCALQGWGLSRAGISKIEAGIRRINDGEILLLADVLEVPILELYMNEHSQKLEVSVNNLASVANKELLDARNKILVKAALVIARHGRED